MNLISSTKKVSSTKESVRVLSPNSRPFSVVSCRESSQQVSHFQRHLIPIIVHFPCFLIEGFGKRFLDLTSFSSVSYRETPLTKVNKPTNKTSSSRTRRLFKTHSQKNDRKPNPYNHPFSVVPCRENFQQVSHSDRHLIPIIVHFPCFLAEGFPKGFLLSTPFCHGF